VLQRLPPDVWLNACIATLPSHQIQAHGKNLNSPRHGRSYWADIATWKMERVRETGLYPKTINVTT